MSLTAIFGGVGSCFAHMFDLYDSNDKRTDLNHNAELVSQAGKHVESLQPTLKDELNSSVSHHIETSHARARGAKASIFGAGCNLLNAMNNTLIAGLQYGGISNEIFKKVHPIAAQITSGIAGATDVYNGYITASTCLSAGKSWCRAKNPASRDMYWWHMINQGLQTVATLGRGASSFVAVAGIPVPLERVGLGEISSSIIGSVGAAVLSIGSNLICKNRIEAAKKRDYKNREVHEAALKIQQSANEVHMNVYEFASKTHPEDPVLATLATKRPKEGFCAKYCCCCLRKKAKKPAVKKEVEMMRIAKPAVKKEVEIMIDDKQIVISPSSQSPGLELPSLQSSISPSPNSPSPIHPFTEPQYEERLIIE